MKAISVTPVVHVSDIKNAIIYYTDVLGFAVDFEYGDYIGLTYGDICIHLSGPANDGAKKPAGTAHFCFYCDDVNGYFDEITQKGAIIDFPIGDRMYGLRDFAVNDEDGNTLVFGMDI